MTSHWKTHATVWLMCISAAFAGKGVALAAPLFAPVEAGFVGTSFRGIALGQSRAQTEAALAANGMRCFTLEEIAQGGTPPVERLGGDYTTCRITAVEDITPLVLQIRMNMRLNAELMLGRPSYAVSFVNGVASELALSPLFFNAGKLTPRDFAQSIVNNYPLRDGLNAGGGGWIGHTSNGEMVTLRVDSTIGVTVFVDVATSADTLSFN